MIGRIREIPIVSREFIAIDSGSNRLVINGYGSAVFSVDIAVKRENERTGDRFRVTVFIIYTIEAYSAVVNLRIFYK